MILERQHKEALDELAEKEGNLKTIRPTTAKMRRDQHEIKLLENRLDKALVHFNDLQAQNKDLRRQIDVWRKQQRNQTRVNRGFTREITAAVE